MSAHLHRDMDRLHRMMLSQSAAVEEAIERASLALRERRMDLAKQVVTGDDAINQSEVEIEEECLKMLALHQPVASDLRRITTVLKINSDLERIADLAVNIAEQANALARTPEFAVPSKLERMVVLATGMVRAALDAYVNLDVQAAKEICLQDDAVDELNRQIIDEVLAMMQTNPESIPAAMQCFSASRHIERIADHATNISEDIVYLVEGEIARHRHSLMGIE